MTSVWVTEIAQTWLYGAAPLAIALIAFAGLWLWRRQRRDPHAEMDTPFAYGAKPLAIGGVVLVVCLGLSLYRVQVALQSTHDDAFVRFTQQVDRIEAHIKGQFELLLQPLRGIRSTVVARNSLTRAEFRDWVASLGVEQEYPGVSGLAIVDRVQRPDLNAFMAARRAEGAGGFAVHSSGEAADLFIVKYIEPLATNQAALGFDVGSEPVRRVAAERAMRSGRAALSARIELVQGNQKRSGFLYFLPIYTQAAVPVTQTQRVGAFRGWVTAPIIAADFFAQTVAATQGLLEFELFDGQAMNPSDLIFDSTQRLGERDAVHSGSGSGKAMFNADRTILISGQFFHLQVHSAAQFERSVDLSSPARLAAAGSSLSLLLSTVVWLLLAGRARAQAIAQSMNGELSRLALVAHRTINGVVISDRDQRITWVNDGFTRITGYTAQEAIGQKVGILLHSNQADRDVLATIQRDVTAGKPCRAVVLNRGKDGRDYWVDLAIQPLRSSAGEITGFMSVEIDVTEQVLAREALALEKQRADGILLGTNVGTWQFNPQTQEVRVNAQWSAMLGFSPEEVGASPGEFWDSRVLPDDLARSHNAMLMCLRGDTDTYVCEVRVRRKDDSLMWILRRARVLTYLPDGRPEWFAGIHMDITESKHTEDKLRDMEAFLHRAGRAAGVGAWQVNLKTQETIWSDLTCEIHGVETGFRPTQEQALAFYPQGSQALLKAAMEQAPVTCMGWDLTLPFSNSDGIEMWVRSVGEVEFDDSGPVRLVGSLQDVTQAKLAQLEIAQHAAALAHTSATLQSVLDSAVDVAVIATDLNRTITVFNRGAERMLGYRADEMIGQHTTSMLFDLREVAAVKSSLELALGREPTLDEVFAEVAGHPDQAEWTLVRKDGSTLSVSLMISPMLRDSGEVMGHLGIAYDVSRQKEYENSLRTAMVQAEQASVAKSQFLANMSHEIRTPMNAILGMLQLLRNTQMTERQRDYTGKTERAARSLLGLLNDILDFSKVEAGKMQLDPEPFQVEALLGDLSVIFSSNLGVKNVDVLFDMDPTIPPVLVGDAMRLKQILINLGGNAVKFTAQGSVVVQWRLVARGEDRVTIEIAVSDSGIGIAAENQTRIFEGFSQAEASTTRQFGGTGLGLVISQRLVALMGGQLRLSSELGKGSLFSFELDLLVPQVDVAESVIQAPGDLPLLRVLLVDDNALALQTCAAMMRLLGWEVTLASSGEQALQLAKERLNSGGAKFDMVFADWQMPDMDGWNTLRNLRRIYGNSGAPKMVMLSGQGRELLAQRSEREQELLSGFLVKPLTVTMLLSVLHAGGDSAPAVGDADSAGVASRGKLQGMRILVVEDNPINQQVAQELLTAQGASIALAGNGQLGVDAVAAADPQFDVVLMDLQMPVMGGLDAARAIRLELGLDAIPIIAMTANAMASDRQACLAAGMNDHVGKPFALSHLIETLLRHTGWTVASAAAEPATAPGLNHGANWPEGVDVEGALARMGGNVGLYLRTLRAFVLCAGQISDQMDVLLSSGDQATAQRELHSFKGLAATLGVTVLCAIAAKADSVLRQAPEADNLGALLLQIRTEVGVITPVLGAVAARLELLIEPPAAMNRPGGAAAMREHLAELYEALRNADMQAMELHAVFRQSFGESMADSTEALDAAMAELDFDLAATECNTLLSRAPQ